LIQKLRPSYQSFLNLCSLGRGTLWEINGVHFRIDAHYRDSFGHRYDEHLASFIRSRMRPGAVCLDVGANVGVYALQFGHWAGKTGQVIAFEPNPAAQHVMRKHLRLNHFEDRVRIVPAAVGSMSGRAVLYAAGTDAMSRLGAPSRHINHPISQIDVEVVTLDGFCKKDSIEPDWLLIDVEGFEWAVLEGARELIKHRGANLHVIVEMHPDVWDSAGRTRRDAESVLSSLKLQAIPLSGQSDPLAEYGHAYLAPASQSV